MLKPLSDNVLVELIENQEKSPSGIILTGTNKEGPQYAKVIEVGPGTDRINMEVEKDQKVILSKYAGTQIKYKNKELLIIKQNDILAIVKQEVEDE